VAVAPGLDRPWTSLYVVADVHGDYPRLEAALAATDDRPVVLVGDYVDRGIDPRRTLELLMLTVRGRDDVVCLRGNHENRLLEFLRGGAGAVPPGGGALATMRSYVPDESWTAFRDTFPPDHRTFLSSMPLWLETPDLFVSHAGMNPDAPESRTAAALTLGGPERFARAVQAPFEKTVVCGHYIQRGGAPHLGERFIALDLGCGTLPGAPLAVLAWPERTVRTF
jgi:serine/threonine protein phosphatase 1